MTRKAYSLVWENIRHLGKRVKEAAEGMTSITGSDTQEVKKESWILLSK
jgi:hypothetical protein